MLKILPPGSQDFGIDPLALVKVSSKGLSGKDRILFEKRAGHSFADIDFQNLIEPDEALVHAIAVGAHEYYGPNRKGDSFREDVCRQTHDTFVKYGRVFRHHINKNPKLSYGLVKASSYNEAAHRIELLMALPLTEKAASRMGVIIPERELEMLFSGKSLPVSMSCYVDHDVCPACHGRFKKRADYCGPEQCPKYGGLKYNIGRTFDDGFTLFADSQDPVFFDISFVSVPADRTAYTTAILTKSASIFEEPEMPPDWVERAVWYEYAKRDNITQQKELLEKLAELESQPIDEPYSYIPCGSCLDDPTGQLEKTASSETGWKSCLASNVMLPLPVFCRIYRVPTEGVDFQKTASCVFRTLKQASNLDKLLESNAFVEDIDSSYNTVRIKGLAPGCCLDFDNLAKSASFAIISEKRMSKEASRAELTEAEKRTAIVYGLYQLGFILSRRRSGLPVDEAAIISWNRY